MKQKTFLLFLIFAFFPTIGCKQQSPHDDKPFNEEFVTITTIRDYFTFEWKTFGNSVLTDTPEGILREEEEQRRFLYDEYSLYTNPSIKNKSRVLKFKKRDYYCAFYGKNPNYFKNKVLDKYDCLGFVETKGLSNLLDKYTNYVKFKNYYSLNKVSFSYDDFYLYNVIQLIDVYEKDTKIATTFSFQYFLRNDDDKIIFYDLPNYYTDNYQTFNSNNSFFTYYDGEMFNNRTLIPYFYQPYEQSCLMGSRIEIDAKYAYFSYKNGTIQTAMESNVEGDIIKKTRKIKKYDIKKQKTVTEKVCDIYYRVLLSDLDFSF